MPPYETKPWVSAHRRVTWHQRAIMRTKPPLAVHPDGKIVVSDTVQKHDRELVIKQE